MIQKRYLKPASMKNNDHKLLKKWVFNFMIYWSYLTVSVLSPCLVLLCGKNKA